ncbi:hypothetical protein QBC34DRAFT_450849 [Podospora aff. communis PSN243]|uniref:Tyrosinase copper-binding domain-containing protein n=1 Tax=Podospora aff. communis PSN243 TaxID=3040156 RepID=A0AAV9GE37_9PEZI|nr:hypothetical protein QBC34DRAFT_450849 [Podospora aff. communis PSN243]
MKLLHFATLTTAALALPSEPLEPRQQRCTNPKLRKSWAKATNAEKQSYLNAVLCLATKPSKLKISTHNKLYDDFGYVHAQLSNPQKIHFEPAFLPWHRYFVQVYENALRECGYTGAAMYWDWAADAHAPAQAAVFDPVLGFGGNGNDTTGNDGLPRIQNSPLRNLRPTYWNNYVRPHWLSRDSAPGYPEFGVIEMYGYNYNQTIVDVVLAEPVFDEFRRKLENGPHSAVHGGVGGGRGDMGLQDASPNDPLFFLHHTQVDRLWWIWQKKDPNNRIKGNNAYNGVKQDGQGPPVSVNDVLPMMKLAPDAVVKDYLDIQGGTLCYTY